jgi:hypothetical protein
MIKDLFLIANVGAAGNLVRNLLLTSKDVYWPEQSCDRYDTILAQYATDSLSGWWVTERNLDFINPISGVDSTLALDYNTYKQSRYKITSPIVILNHSLLWDINSEFDNFFKDTTMLYITPLTAQGLEWQVRALHFKCVDGNNKAMMDFSFNDNKEEQVTQFISENGQHEYFKMNTINMREILERQQKQFLEVNKHIPVLSIEELITADPNLIIEKLMSIFGIRLDQTAITILNCWRKLHWAYQDTYNWEFCK